MNGNINPRSRNFKSVSGRFVFEISTPPIGTTAVWRSDSERDDSGQLGVIHL